MSKRINPATNEVFGCADCHMGNKLVGDDGVEYTSHLLISPVDNKELLASTCNTGSGCHTDLAAQVDAWQETYMEQVLAIGQKLKTLNEKLADAVANGTLSADDLTAVRELNRESQWYWDFAMVENSDGSHYPAFSDKVLALSDELVDKALNYF